MVKNVSWVVIGHCATMSRLLFFLIKTISESEVYSTHHLQWVIVCKIVAASLGL